MVSTRVLLFCALISLVSGIYCFSQQEDIRWVPLNVPQLSESQVLWLDGLTRSSHSERYSEALGYLGSQVDQGNISAADTAAIQVLKRISLSPYLVVQNGNNIQGATVELRQQAVRLLGYIGGEYSLGAVDEILQYERDSVVLAALFTVYKEIAPPFNGYRAGEFTRILKSAQYRNSGELLVESIISAINSMHRRTFSMSYPDLFGEILRVTRNGHNYSVRRKALELAQFIAGAQIDDPGN